jgi:uncharacterized damage-inducible protein DinB
MDPRLSALVEIFNLNTRLFRELTDNLSDEQARERPSNETYSIVFLACHLVEARDCLARLVGIEKTRSLAEVLQSVTTVVELNNEPPLDQVKEAWEEVTALLWERIPCLSSDSLDQESSDRFPLDNSSVFGGLVFLLHHESYHIGQLAFLRRYLGVGARYGHRAILSETSPLLP